MINIAKPNIGEEEIEAVEKVMRSGMIASGKVVNEFEQKFAHYIGNQYGIATTSGTTALEVAIRAMGIGKGDKVLTTAYSFIASTNAIVYTGATPVFVDIDIKSFNLLPEQIEEHLKKDASIKAILIVHLFGRPCEMDKILFIAKKYNIKLIEDCAQAHGATWKGRKVGSFGDVAAFSFYPTKNMTTGEGGIVLTNDEIIAKNARTLINHGMEIRYYHDEIGYNYRMTNIAASIGLCQLAKLEQFNRRRRENARFYFDNIQNILFVLPEDIEGHVYHQFTIKVVDGKRQKLIEYLEKQEIGCGIFYPLSIPEQKCYSVFDFITEYKNVDLVKTQVVSIPIHPLLSKEDLLQVVKVLNEFK